MRELSTQNKLESAFLFVAEEQGLGHGTEGSGVGG